MEAQKTDYDLDVLNVLKLFPKGNEDCYIYVRSNKLHDEEEKGLQTFVSVQGSQEMLLATTISLIMKHDHFKGIFYNAVINSLRMVPREEALRFLFGLYDAIGQEFNFEQAEEPDFEE